MFPGRPADEASDMATIRANCPTCGQVDLPAEEISLEVAAGGDRGRYAFTCPDCSADITRAADGRVVGLLRAAGATSNVAEAPEPKGESLPAADRNPCRDAPPFTMDDMIDLHFLLQDETWLAQELASGRLGETAR
jgi:hypothetical protein